MAGFLGETTTSIINPLSAIWYSLVGQLPGIVAAVIVLIVGGFVAVILGHALKVVLEKLKVDEYVRKARLTKTIGHTHVPAVAGEIFKWYIIILFLQQAVALINLGTLSMLLGQFVGWLPNVIVAVVILLFGIAAANYIYYKTWEHSKQKGVKASAGILKAVIIFMILLMSLKQIGVDVGILEHTFLLIVGALAIGIALALGIGLGLGLRKESENIIKGIRKNF
ncbi:hypothetical protein HOF78_00760 [Candidatus Woesearchaeota archaeon]|mgnify:FL=1|nr:hypothetical protein [Candidatus Woesearchaeota archaeon]MBT6044432.1 hypothetical protein [Candidatus Woesearchaeota archaeon]